MKLSLILSLVFAIILVEAQVDNWDYFEEDTDVSFYLNIDKSFLLEYVYLRENNSILVV